MYEKKENTGLIVILLLTGGLDVSQKIYESFRRKDFEVGFPKNNFVIDSQSFYYFLATSKHFFLPLTVILDGSANIFTNQNIFSAHHAPNL